MSDEREDPPSGARQALLEEVLGEYMQAVDRGETVDREQLLARHPEVAEELRSYFAGCDELVQLGWQAGAGAATEHISRVRPEDAPPDEGSVP